MASPFIPQVIINVDFQTASSATVQPAAACIVGPHTQLVRYAQPAEKAFGGVGDYIPGADTFYSWPHLQVGGLVNLGYAKLFADNAKMVFFSDLIGSDQTVTPVTNKPNRVAINGSAGFAQNGNNPRLAGLYGRDVRVGDSVRVSGNAAGTIYTVDSYITGLTGDNTVAVTGTVVADAGNHTSQAGSTAVTQVSGAVNCWTVVPNATNYNGFVDGYINDAYTVTVLQGSTGHDPATAVLQVKSASGLDDVASFVPAAVGNVVTVGRRGLQLGVSYSGGACDLVAGQSWQIAISAAFTATVVTSGGIYTDGADDTYVITVLRGGKLSETDPTHQPLFGITTIKGLDSGGPLTVLTAGQAYATGTHGVTFSLDSGTTAVCRGDRFYISVTAAKLGRISTLILANSLPAQLSTAGDLNLWLYRQQSVQIPRNRVGFDPIVNYTPTATGVTVAQGIVLYDPAFVDGFGAPLPLTLISASLFVEYQAYLPVLANDVSSVADVGNINAAISGAIDPDNPLKYNVSKALIGSATTPVYFIAVANPFDPASWAEAIKRLVGVEGIYNIVPLTYDPVILSLFVSHVTTQSTPEAGFQRALFIGLKATTSRIVVGQSTSSDGNFVLATVVDDPATPNNQYTLLTVPTDNAKFMTQNVQPGDEVRFGYTTAFGQLAYSSYQVASVLSEQQLYLVSGPASQVAQAQRLEIWHTLPIEEIKDDLKFQAANYSNTRVCAVASDLIGFSKPTTDTYSLAAAQAGLISGALPHQAMTNAVLDGFADAVAAKGLLNGDQVADLCGNGVWLISRAPSVQSNAVICRYGTTTDSSSLATQEEMVRRNVDSMRKYLSDRLGQYLGTSNVTPSMESALRVDVDAAHSFLMTSGYTQKLGAQMIAVENVSVLPSLSLADRFVVTATWYVPAPTNTIEYDATVILGIPATTASTVTAIH